MENKEKIKQLIQRANMQNAMQPQVQINPLDYPNVKCDKCGNEVFKEAYIMKKIPSTVTGAKDDTLAPIPVLVCSKCGAIMEDYRKQLNLDENGHQLENKKSTNNLIL